MKIAAITTVCASVLGLSACTSHISRGINDDGAASEVVFPQQKDAWVAEGTYPNLDNLRHIGSGVTKEDLYDLVGRPHFSETQHAREWDYILKFKQPDGSVNLCQYKVIFDKNMRGQSFYWLPEDCARELAVSAPKPVVAAVPVRSEVVSLSADVLFGFDKWQPEDILAGGHQQLAELADKVAVTDANRVQVHVQGHTDRLGDDVYNQLLSQQRANTVRKVLIDQGLDPRSVSAQGYGESQPIKQCAGGGRALIGCLAPNRRVDITINYF